MVVYRILDYFRKEPTLIVGQPTRLPPYFPVEPAGCKAYAQNLFSCLSNEATAKARDLEKAGLHKSYFADVQPRPGSEHAARLIAEGGADVDENLPKPGENPLDECRLQIAYYQRCCDRELKKPKNWILTEPYRVQEEYRYKGPSDASAN